MRKTNLKLILPSPSSWPDLTSKMKKRSEKIIPRRRYHLRLDVAVRKEKSPCRHADEVVDATFVVLIFSRAAMEKTIPPCPLAIVGEKKEEINPRYQETWHGEIITPKTRSTRKLIKNDGSPLPPASDEMSEGGERGTSGGDSGPRVS